jgi:prolyl-tRNA synthetase
MLWSKSYLFTLKETPSDAEIPSHQLMVRGGYIKKVAQGIFTYGPLALRAIRKFENIVREELNNRQCIEVLMPMVQPRELWDETNRWTDMGKGLLKFKNRLDQDFCLGATHEEVITDFVRHDVKSYRDLPFNLYQIQTKYRDEVRPRFGLMRGREFIMKDAYSFDTTEENAKKAYQLMYEAYTAIFKRLGVNFVSVKADSGNIGGNLSEEFHIIASSGEDGLMVSEDGKFAANIEVCPAFDADVKIDELKKLGAQAEAQTLNLGSEHMEKFATPNLKTIDQLAKSLNKKPNELVKTMFYATGEEGAKDIKPICVLLRGDDEVNPVKIKNLLKLANPPLLLTDKEVFAVTGAMPGSCGPVGIKIPVYMDYGVVSMKDYTVGANSDDHHLKNVNHCRDYKVTQVADLRMVREGDKNPDGSGLLKSHRGIEVGHIFHLGSKYSKAMNANYLNEKGESTPIEMGCYGVGISRTVQAIIEQCNDKDGIIWPASIAPFVVHIALLDPKDNEASLLAMSLYEKLNSKGIDCFIDDRDERPGVKFKDADLLGMPVRINIGRRGVQANEIEVIDRKTKQTTKLPSQDVFAFVESWYQKQIKGH